MKGDRPDPQAIVEQLLLSHVATHGSRLARRMGLLRGGFALLRAAGLAKQRARAVNQLAYRQARAWRRDGVIVDAQMAADEAQRLLV